jgi:hypothetical protein
MLIFPGEVQIKVAIVQRDCGSSIMCKDYVQRRQADRQVEYPLPVFAVMLSCNSLHFGPE